MLIEDGLSMFDRTAELIRTSNCGCGITEVVLDDSGIYQLGPQKCSSAGGGCGVSHFFDLNRQSLAAILEQIRSTDQFEKSTELSKAELLIQKYLKGEIEPTAESPCLNYGDVTISLESKSIKRFFTANTRESSVLCAALNQVLLVFSIS